MNKRLTEQNKLFELGVHNFQLVELIFNDIYTEAGCDYIYVYDGVNTLSPLINSYTGEYSPPFPSCITTQRYMSIRFTSDWNTGYQGFIATYISTSPTGSNNVFFYFVNLSFS